MSLQAEIQIVGLPPSFSMICEPTRMSRILPRQPEEPLAEGLPFPVGPMSPLFKARRKKPQAEQERKEKARRMANHATG